MRYKNYFLVLLLSLTACASNQWESSEVEEGFVTDIKTSGLKIFNYSLTRTTPQASGRSANNKGSGKHAGRGGMGGKGGSYFTRDRPEWYLLKPKPSSLRVS